MMFACATEACWPPSRSLAVVGIVTRTPGAGSTPHAQAYNEEDTRKYCTHTHGGGSGAHTHTHKSIQLLFGSGCKYTCFRATPAASALVGESATNKQPAPSCATNKQPAPSRVERAAG